MNTNDDTTPDDLAAEVAASQAKDRKPRKRAASSTAKKSTGSTRKRSSSSSSSGAPTRRTRAKSTPDKIKPAAPSPKGGRPTNDARVQASIERAVAMIALSLVLVNQRDAEIVAEAAPAIAQRTTDVVRKYPKVYAFLISTEDTAPWIGLASVLVAGVGLPIAANHGVLSSLPAPFVKLLDGMRQQAIADATPLDDLAPEPEPDKAPASS